VSEIHEFLELAVRIAKDAGALLTARPEHLSIDTKSSDIDIVTQMDRASEKLIVESILAARPDDGIIGEEGANHPGSSGYTWVIDPIDGTVNYFYNMAGWSVSIAVKDQEGTAVGVVYSPTTSSLFTATRGGGSYLNGRSLNCNNPIELDRALIATGFAYRKELREKQISQFNDLILKIRDYRRNGSAAIDICHVAAGIVDGYYEMGLKEWDRAAAELIAIEAGAKVSVHGELTIAAGAHLYGILSGHLLG
jgi:myo-inositol-1(or 4)-monophosphatase